MSARKCFAAKVRAGKVGARAGKALLDLIDQFEQEHGVGVFDDPTILRKSAIQAAIEATHRADRQTDLVAGNIIAQANVLRAVRSYEAKIETLRATKGDFGFGNKAPPTLGKATQTPLGFAVRSLLARDPWEIADWQNVHYLARTIRAQAQATFAAAIDHMRAKALGLKAEHARELDVLRGLYGETVPAEAKAAAEAFTQSAENLRQQFNEAGGLLAERKNWRLPNPDLDPAKVSAMGRDAFRRFVTDRVDRNDMLDNLTKQPLSDMRFNDLLDRVFDIVSSDGSPATLPSGTPDVPSGTLPARRMLANSRDVGRFFSWKDSASWMQVAEAFGTHQSPFHSMMAHIGGMADDIAAMRILGPNPEATKRFMAGLFDRESKRLAVQAENTSPAELAAATRQNRSIENRVKVEKKLTDNLYAEVRGLNRIPQSLTLARGIGDVRHLLAAAQLGSAMISKFNDVGMLAMTARMNALPFMSIIKRGIELAGARGSEVHLAQMGLTADSMAHMAGETDRLMGETIRSGMAAKISSAVIRASGLRRWNAVLRGAFGLEMMAHVARNRALRFAELSPEFRDALNRYGIADNDWNHIAGAAPFEPRPNALFTRPEDVMAGGTADHVAAADKLARMIHTEMDFAIIEHDPVVHSLIVGDTRPGTISGEIRRSGSMYRGFISSIVSYHGARAFARGWDGSRLGHAGITFLLMSAFGALSMQAKELNQGRDTLSLDPTTAKGLQAWGKSIVQGGGLGVFGDLMFADKTRTDNTWASTFAGPVAGLGEDVLGKFLMRNIQLAAAGKPTHFAGDALYTAGRYMPGSTLWYSKLAFNRAVLDQAAQIIDPRARERFQRAESEARRDYGQSYFWHPGSAAPSRMPSIAGTP
jgi:hypothetical protein